MHNQPSKTKIAHACSQNHTHPFEYNNKCGMESICSNVLQNPPWHLSHERGSEGRTVCEKLLCACLFLSKSSFCHLASVNSVPDYCQMQPNVTLHGTHIPRVCECECIVNQWQNHSDLHSVNTGIAQFHGNVCVYVCVSFVFFREMPQQQYIDLHLLAYGILRRKKSLIGLCEDFKIVMWHKVTTLGQLLI